jgi:hypothetical protein
MGGMRDAPRDQDIVELGGPGLGRRLFGGRFRLPDGWGPSPGWRPSRGTTAFAVTALTVGLVAGYTAGDWHGRRGPALPGPAPASSSSAAAVPAASLAFMYPPLMQDSGACSVQSGRRLTLGVQFTNSSPVPVTLRSARAVLPLGGLIQGSWHWAPCGALPATLVQADVILLPGGSTWLTMTFTVKDGGCPAPLPVQFAVGYQVADRSATANLPGFPDLGGVPYTGCPPVSPGIVSIQVTPTPDRGTSASRMTLRPAVSVSS